MDSGNTFFVGLQGGPPWGFRLQGGREYRAPLSVTKVNENSKAEAADMQIGDVVKSINGAGCDNMTHSEALSTIRRAGMQLQIVLERQDRNANDNYGSAQNYRSGVHQYDNHPGQGYQPGNQNAGARVSMGNSRRSRVSQDDYDQQQPQQPQDNYNYQGRYQNPSGATHGQNHGGNYNDNYGRPDNNQNGGRNAQMPGKNSWIPAKPESYRQDYEDDWSNNDQGGSGGFWPQKTDDRKEDDSSGARTYNTLPNQRNQNSFQPIQPGASHSQKPLSRTGSVKSLGNDYNQPQYSEQYDPRYQPRYNEHEDYKSGGGWQDNARLGGAGHSKSTPSLAQPEDDNDPYGRNKYYDDHNDNQDSRYHDHNRPFRHDDNDSRKSDSRKYEDEADYHPKPSEITNLNDIDEKGLIFDAPSNYNIHDKTIPKCKAIYSFKPASKRELSLKKGDIIMLTKNVDKNWFEGILHGKRGIFPANHIEVVTSIKEALAAQCEYSHDGLGQARRDFSGVTTKELSFSKGQIITLLKHVDANWFEGRLNSRTGLIPKKFINVIKDLKGTGNVGSMKQPRNNRNKDHIEDIPRHDRHTEPNTNQYLAKPHNQPHDYNDNNQQADDGYNYYDGKPQYQGGDYNYQPQENDYYGQDARAGRNNKQDVDARSAGGYDARYDGGNDPYDNKPQQRQNVADNRNNNYGDHNNNRRSQRYQSETDYSDNHSQSGNRNKTSDLDQNNYYNDGAADNSNFPPANSEASESRYRAFYPYAPEKEDELELLVGDIIIVKEKCDDGWFVGSSTRTGHYGTFPGNFVEPVY